MEHPSAVESDPLAQILEGAGEALRRLFDEADEPRLLLTADRVVVLVNQAAERMLGRDRSQVIGQPARVLAPARLSEDYWRVYETLLEQPDAGTVQINLWALRADGSEFPVRIAARVVQLRSGATYFSLVVVDWSDTARGPSGPLRNFLNAVSVGSVIADADGRIVLVNSRALAKFGYEESELIGQPVEILMPSQQRGHHVGVRQRFIGNARTREMALGTRVVGCRKDGTTFPVSVTLSSLGTEKEVLIAASVRDLTDVESLRGKSEMLKEQFMATVSHELRTPLTSILGSVELLADEVAGIQDDELRVRLERYTAMITRGAQRQLHLVEDLLTVTAIDGSSVGQRHAMADLRVVIENVIHDYQRRAEAVGLTLTADTHGIPILVRGEERWLERALECVVSNAVKFTPPGGSIETRVTRNSDLAWVDVADTGPGIPAHEAAQVFDRLYRGQYAIDEAKQGAGLGLAIARSIIEDLGGELNIVPQQRGSCFRITVPLVTKA